MQFQRIARTDSEKAYIVTLNSEASSITTGYAAALAVGNNASFDGATVVMPASGTAANLPGWLGIAKNDIAPNAYGLIQVWGAVASVFLSQTGTSVTINVGDPLVPGAAKGGLTSLLPTYAASGFKYVVASNVPVALSAANQWASGWIRGGL